MELFKMLMEMKLKLVLTGVFLGLVNQFEVHILLIFEADGIVKRIGVLIQAV